jgi:predicted O-methyltransferase YrrM
MEHFYKDLGENWFTYPEVYSMVVNKFPTNSHFVEVGVWKGMSAAYMAVEIKNSGKNIRFDCVDTWDIVPTQSDIPETSYDNLYEIFLNNIEPVKELITPVKSLSWDAAALYEDQSLDFIFIDAAHDYESVKKDINAWFPKLKKQGIIAGHDYASYAPGVVGAVNEFFTGKPIYGHQDCWIYQNEE